MKTKNKIKKIGITGAVLMLATASSIVYACVTDNPSATCPATIVFDHITCTLIDPPSTVYDQITSGTANGYQKAIPDGCDCFYNCGAGGDPNDQPPCGGWNESLVGTCPSGG